MLDTPLNLLQETAHHLRTLEDETTLFAQINGLDRLTIQSLMVQYQGVEQHFSPVNLLRYEVLNQLEEGRPPLSAADVELIRQEIEERNVAFFEKYGTRLTEGLASYAKKDPFRNWQKGGRLSYFKLFHTFFYRKNLAPIIREALHEIGNELLRVLQLQHHRLHLVDFSGSHRYGTSNCWLAIYPPERATHVKAHQLFCRISAQGIHAGIWSGRAILRDRQETVDRFDTLAPVLTFLGSLLPLYKQANDQLSKDFQVAETQASYDSPGENDKEPSQQLLQADDFLEEALAVLNYKRNLILQGPPGVGKTFVAQRLAEAILGGRDPGRLRIVQFHQSYAYEDFVQGYRPDGHGGFRLRNGVFYEFCQLAQRQPTRPFVLVIDEINRGNLSKIFGELLLLLEADKRNVTHAIALTYSETAFYIPPNLFLIATMNTADRSLAMVDYALRRRFAFMELEPEFGDKFIQLLYERGVEIIFAERIAASLQSLNQTIKHDPSLSASFCIGHSYFLNPTPNHTTWLRRIINLEIAPLLREYWFDDSEKAVFEINKLLTIAY
ncbi:MAG: AAA family ATPase [Cytophagaceae bacterium]|nr:AAA family ATPase [Cytophagaceae bacterium]